MGLGCVGCVFGYDASIPRGQPQPDSATIAVIIGMVWIPIGCCIGQLALLRFYRLDEDDLKNTRRHSLGQE